MLFSTTVGLNAYNDYVNAQYNAFHNEGIWLCRERIDNIFTQIYNTCYCPNKFKIEVYNRKGKGRFFIKVKEKESYEHPYANTQLGIMEIAHCVYNTMVEMGLLNKKLWVKFIPIE